ncbi:MAG TPA: T9SS type A sorting domain-containing protein [Phnomibacter sp.]|nr:T9SS type A sorting domain-containing protein [Phnomibacter sp.]
MKKIYTIRLVAAIAVSGLLSFNASAQSGVYFREGFAPGSAWPSSAAAAMVPDPKAAIQVTLPSGVWTTFGAYRTNGGTGACTVLNPTADPNHLRMGNLNAITMNPAYNINVDSATLITPEVTAGIYNMTYYNGRTGRILLIYKTYDVGANPTNWTLVQTTSNTYTACDLFTIAVNDANARRLKIVARAGTDSDIDSIVLTSVDVLPSKLGSIDAQWKKDGVQVTWEASNELNVKGYYVQRSDDGGNTFKDVAFVPSLNRLYGTYTYSDKTTGTGLAFYRIKGQDLDGRTTYGKIVKLQLSKALADGVWIVNPVVGRTFEMQLNNLPKGIYNIQVLDASGKSVGVKSVNVQGEKMSTSMTISNSAARGVYTVSVRGAGLSTNKRVVLE